MTATFWQWEGVLGERWVEVGGGREAIGKGEQIKGGEKRGMKRGHVRV